MSLRNDPLLALLSFAAIGAGIYLALKMSESGTPASDTVPDYTPPYDPYATGDDNTAYAGTIEPMSKERFSPRTLKTSPQEMAKIEQFEGRRSTAYRDSAGNLTIGIGHLIKSGDGLSANSVLNDAQINSLFASDLLDAEAVIYTYVTVPLSQGEFDALIDFIFQFGATKFAGSTLLRLLNARNYDAVPAEFAKWVNVSGVPNSGVMARRADDASTFLT
jgi:lysozyme